MAPIKRRKVIQIRAGDVGKRVPFTPRECNIVGGSFLEKYNKAQDDKIEEFTKEWSKKLEDLNEAHLMAFNNATSPKRRIYLNKKLRNNRIKLDNEKSAAWVSVRKVLYDWKIRQLASATEVKDIGEYLADDRFIPRGGHYVTFPVHSTEDNCDDSNGTALTVTWQCMNTTFEAKYYKTTGWFGSLVEAFPSSESASQTGTIQASGQSNKPTRFEPFGETDIFIAAEFIETRYQGAPHLAGVHLKDKFKDKSWATLQIDHRFDYGQNSEEPTYRYLVYHPFVRPRKIPQRSFATGNVVNMSKIVAEAMKKNSEDNFSSTVAIAGMSFNKIEQWLSHNLHTFELIEDSPPLYGQSKEMQQLNQELASRANDIEDDVDLAVDELKHIALVTGLAHNLQQLAVVEAEDDQVQQQIAEQSASTRPEQSVSTGAEHSASTRPEQSASTRAAEASPLVDQEGEPPESNRSRFKRKLEDAINQASLYSDQKEVPASPDVNTILSISGTNSQTGTVANAPKENERSNIREMMKTSSANAARALSQPSMKSQQTRTY